MDSHSRKYIVILEDDHRRRVEMFRLIDEKLTIFDAIFFRTAQGIANWLAPNWEQVVLASLDHDLEDLVPPKGMKAESAGDGRDAVASIIKLSPSRKPFPVLVHSTNVPASHSMVELLREAKFAVDRIAPYGDLIWIEETWYPSLKKMLKQNQ